MRIAVIGGGISGLAAAHGITELLPHAELLVFEATDRLGGVLQTSREDGFLIEHSADSFITKLPWAVDLCRRLGIDDELLPTDESRRRASVVCRGKLLRVPDGFVLMAPSKFWPLVTTPVLSWPGKLRLLAEPFIVRRVAGVESSSPQRHVHDSGGGEDADPSHPKPEPSESTDESVAAFATRRLGREAFERLVQPLLAGIYTADPDKLSMAATLPELLAREQSHGSLYRGLKRAKPDSAELETGVAQPAPESGARYGQFVAPREGVGQLVQALANRLPVGTVQLNADIEGVRPDGSGRWLLTLGGRDLPPFDAVIVALPSHAAATLLVGSDATLATELAQIEYAGCAVVSFGYRRNQLGRSLDGFGFVVPRIENRPIIAASFASEKFPGRAPEGHVVIRVFVGGALQPELAELPADELAQLAHKELACLLQITGPPIRTVIARWPRSMPQYHVGHLPRIASIEARVAQLPGLALAGNAYHGVGIPQCIHSGATAAEQVASCLDQRSG